MYLTVVWDITPDTRFFYISQAVGWGVPAALLTAAMSISGVSFRFGSTCHINHDKSMMTFWGWLLAVAGSAVIIQISTYVLRQIALRVLLTLHVLQIRLLYPRLSQKSVGR
jgi:hypothetical protein